MELLFESRLDVGVSGKVHFFQHRPTVSDGPVMELDSFVDGAGASLYGSILRDGGRMRMWYQAWPKDWDGQNCELVGYAESDDGLSWTKPSLGLVDYAGKGKANNLVNLRGHPPTVFIDPDAPDSHRYRATMCCDPFGNGYGYYTAHSSDGFEWTYDGKHPRWRSADVIQSIYHPWQKRGISAMKFTPRINGLPRRSIWHAEFVDGEWSDAHRSLVPDDFDDVTAQAHGFVSADYYGMGMQAAGSGTVGFIWQFRHSLPRTQGSAVGVFGVVDVTLAYQAARGDVWQHVHGRPDFIRHDDPSWGHGGVYTASCPVEVGDEHWLYFSASRHSHGWYVDDKWQINEALKQGLIDGGICRIGFARWPKWRLFGFHSDPIGRVDLKLSLDKPSRLKLNYQCEPGGSIRPAIDGSESRTADNAVALTGDELAKTVVFNDGDVIQPAADGKPVNVNLHLDRASVFAFEVEEAS